MAALSIAASSIYYAEMTKVVTNPTPQDVVVTDMLLSKHYGYAYFSLRMMSNVKSDITFQVSIIGEDGVIAWQMRDVHLPAMSEIVVSESGSCGSDFFVGKTYIIKIEGGVDMAYTVECTGVEVSTGKIYLLAINSITGNFTEEISSSIVPEHIDSVTSFDAIAETTLWFAGATKSKSDSMIDLSNKRGDDINSTTYPWQNSVPVCFNITYSQSQNLLTIPLAIRP